METTCCPIRTFRAEHPDPTIDAEGVRAPDGLVADQGRVSRRHVVTCRALCGSLAVEPSRAQGERPLSRGGHDTKSQHS
jgi:hypothetical protein